MNNPCIVTSANAQTDKGGLQGLLGQDFCFTLHTAMHAYQLPLGALGDM